VRARILEGEQGIGESVALLRAGEVVALPTETVYGLAGDAFQPLALARIFEAKGRPLSDPLIVHLPEAGWLERVVRFESLQQSRFVMELASALWPGPLTLLLPKREDLPELVTAGSLKVAVRVTSHPLFQEVLRRLDSPLAAPSANRFGRISPTSAEDVRIELGKKIPAILDGGLCQHGMESSIVEVVKEGMRILRPGPISEDQLKKYGHIIATSGIVNTPGSLPGHYAPGKELHILEKDISTLVPDPKVALLAFSAPPAELLQGFAAVEVLSPGGDLREAAANFYGALRRLDSSEADMIWAEPLPEQGIGIAVMDRMRRSSYGSRTSSTPASGHQGGAL